MTPVLSEAQMKEAVNDVKNLLVAKGAEMIHEEKWGLKKLAYPIQKKSTGFYHLLEYKTDGEHIQKFEVELKRDQRLLRFLTTKLEKHAVVYNEKKRRNAKEKKEETK